MRGIRPDLKQTYQGVNPFLAFFLLVKVGVGFLAGGALSLASNQCIPCYFTQVQNVFLFLTSFSGFLNFTVSALRQFELQTHGNEQQNPKLGASQALKYTASSSCQHSYCKPQSSPSKPGGCLGFT